MSNNLLRTISGTVFGIVMLCGLLFNGYLFSALIIFMMCSMMAEFYKMTMGDDYKFSRILAIASGVILYSLIYLAKVCGAHPKFVALAIIPVIVVMVNSLLVKDRSEFLKFAYIYTGILYIAVPLSLSNLIAFQHGVFNGTLLICFFVIIWCSDVGAYILGCSLGQKYGKKICPEISPKKSWIGFWGGFLFAIIAAVVLHFCNLLQAPLLHCIILASLMHVAGVCGDFFESQWKRCCGLKDSGNIIPGHGGMLDRFDSTLMAMPIGAIYLAIFNLI